MTLRSEGASTRPSSTRCSRSAAKARVRPRIAVKTSAAQRSPSAASAEASAGMAKLKTTRVDTTKRSIAGTVSRDRSSSSRSFRASVRASREIRHASASAAGEGAHDGPARAWRARSSARPPGRRARRREAPPFAVEARIRLVEEEQLGLVQERAAEREPLGHPAREGATRSRRASQSPNRSSSIPMRSPRSGTW